MTTRDGRDRNIAIAGVVMVIAIVAADFVSGATLMFAVIVMCIAVILVCRSSEEVEYRRKDGFDTLIVKSSGTIRSEKVSVI
jgi:cation transport ATPase